MSILLTELNQQGLLTLTLNRPDKLNALNGDVLDALAQALTQADNDSQTKGIIITGAGKAFCAGADINRLAECNAESGYQFAKHGQAVFRQLETLSKPTIAAINGYAFGGGCELAISTHLRIGSEYAQFGQPEIKLGVIPGYGGTQRLARLIGKGRAMDLCLTGRFIKAQQALDWGIITDLCKADELIPKAEETLLGIIEMAPLAIKGVIESIDYGYDMSLEQALHLEAIQFAKTCATEDKQEGVCAFLAKRAPEFKGE